MTVKRALLVVAFLCFALAAIGLAAPVNLLAAGLAFWVLTAIL